MASGPTDGAKEKQRYIEGKVYRRRVFKGHKKNPNFGDTVDSSTTAVTTVNTDPNNNSATVNKDAPPPQLAEEGSTAQPQDNSRLEDGNSPHQKLEGQNLAQQEVGSRTGDGNSPQPQLEDQNSAQQQESLTNGDGKSPQKKLEEQNLAQPLESSRIEDRDSPQQRLEEQNLAQPPESSRTEDKSSPQQQLEEHKLAQPPETSRTEDKNSPQQSLEEQNLAQQQVSTRTEDGNSPQQQLEDQSLAQPIESSRTEGRSSPQTQANSRQDEGNSPQPQENSIPEDGNSSQVETNLRLEDGNLPQPELNSKLEDRTSQQQDNSILEDGNLTQPQVNLRLEEGSSPQPLVNSTLEDQNSAQQLPQPISDDFHSHQQAEPSNLDAQQEDDRPSSPIHMPEANSDDLHSHQQAGPSNLDVLQEDRPSSLIHRQGAVASTGYQHSVDVTVEPSMEDRFKINLASKSKQEKQEIRWKLEGELDVVRSLVKRIEVKQGHVGGYGNSNVVLGGAISNGGGAKRAHSEVASAGVSRQFIRPMQHQLSFPMLHNSRGVSENVEKEKRMPKANQFYQSSEFLLAKDKFPPAESNKKSKLNWKRQGGGELGHGLRMGSKFFKSCSSLLEKLMKHKHAWVFNTPVDVEGLGLHDYFTIITHPMDLGTVKTRLNKNWYKSPKEFAEDVRLTFRNAMTYNPKGQDVHVMAENLSKIFEDRWAIIESDYNREMRYGMEYGAPSPLPRSVPGFTPPALDMRRILDRSESLARTPRSMSNTPSSRTPAPKKPKAKDPHKRDMTYEEKQKLSTNLQSLPPDKLDAIVQIIKRKNLAVNQQGDEIEVDIDSVDAETLWELDRFVTNYKKSLSKNKRRAELAQARAEALQNAMQKIQPPAMVEIPRETQADERNVPPSLPMQAGSQADNRSRSSSSSSSSSDSGSSSSDSDSDSSSSSGSDPGSQQT